MVTGKLSSGTLLYMSPEQLKGAPPKAAQDVYSFAAMAYECLTGHPPFFRGAIEDQIKNEPPKPLGPHFANCGGVMAGLAKDPASRPDACTAVLEHERTSSPSRMTILCVLGGIVLAALLVGWWFFRQPDRHVVVENPEPPTVESDKPEAPNADAVPPPTREEPTRPIQPTDRERLATCLARGDFSAARPIAEKLLTEDPQDSSSHFALGMYYYLIVDDLVRAERHLLLAAERNPQEPAVYNNLGMIQIRLKRYADAAENVARALAQSPDNPSILDTKNQLLAAVHEMESACAMLNQDIAECTKVQLRLVSECTVQRDMETFLRQISLNPASIGAVGASIPREVADAFLSFKEAGARYDALAQKYTDYHPQMIQAIAAKEAAESDLVCVAKQFSEEAQQKYKSLDDEIKAGEKKRTEMSERLQKSRHSLEQVKAKLIALGLLSEASNTQETSVGQGPTSVDARPVETPRFGAPLFYSTSADGWTYFYVKLIPVQNLSVLPKDLAVLIDETGSMGKDRMLSVKNAVKSGLRNWLKAGDRFNLVAIRESGIFAYKGWQDVCEASFDSAERWLERQAAFGKGDMFASLESVLNLPRNARRPMVVLVVTDGEVSSSQAEAEVAVSRFTTRNHGNVSVYIYAVKRNADKELLDALARANGGASYVSDDPPNRAAQGLVRWFLPFSKPVLTDMTISSPNGANVDIRPLLPNNLCQGDSVEIFGRVPQGKNQIELTISGLSSLDQVTQTLELDLQTAKHDASIITKWSDLDPTP